MSVAQQAPEVTKVIHNFVAGELVASSGGRDGSLFNLATGEQSGSVGFSNAEDNDHVIYFPEGVHFYTRLKTVTSRWLTGIRAGAEFNFPTHK